MILQEFDQDEDCTHSILVGEGGDPSGDGQDWQPRTEGIWLLFVLLYTVIICCPPHPNFSSAW